MAKATDDTTTVESTDEVVLRAALFDAGRLAAISTTAAAALPGPHPDAELLELERRFERNDAAYHTIDDDETEAVLDANESAIEDLIVNTPAATIAGMLVKLRLLRRLEVPTDRECEYLTERLVQSVFLDAERLAEETRKLTAPAVVSAEAAPILPALPERVHARRGQRHAGKT